MPAHAPSGVIGPVLRSRLAWFAGHRWPVFALTGSKRPYAGCRDCPRAGHAFAACPHSPRFCHGHLAASQELEHLLGLFAARPASVPGISLGAAGLVVLDCDSAAHGELTAAPWATIPGVRDGIGVLRVIHEQHVGTPWPSDTLTVATPSGGAHVYYQLPDELQVLSKPLVTGALIDVKSRGGYVVAPGSITNSGTYRRTSDTLEPAPAPPWLLDYLTGTGHITPRTNQPPPAARGSAPALRRTGPLTDDAVARRVDGIGSRLASCRSGRHAAIATASTALAYLVAGGQLTNDDARDVLIEAAVAAYQGTDVSPRRAERDALDAWRTALTWVSATP